MAAKAESDAVLLKAKADAEVKDSFAREMGMRRVEIDRISAFGNNTIFVPTDASSPLGNSAVGGIGHAMSLGLANGLGSARSNNTA